MVRRWRHVMIGTRCSWLHGDQRGFRSRGHRIHSSGDYRNPPPLVEHAGLRRYHQKRSGKSISLRLELRIRVLRAFVEKMRRLGYRIIACSVGRKHLHAEVELPPEHRDIVRIVGKCKQKASHAVRDVLPGSIWSEGGKYEEIDNVGHLGSTYSYIRTKQEAGTVVWSHRADEDWIARPRVGVVVMGRQRKRTRVFAKVQTPESERKRGPGSSH